MSCMISIFHEEASVMQRNMNSALNTVHAVHCLKCRIYLSRCEAARTSCAGDCLKECSGEQALEASK